MTGYSYGYNKTATAAQIQMESPPEDTVILLKFVQLGTQKSNFLFCCSWDGSIRAWKEEPSANTTSTPKWKLFGSYQESKQAILRFCFEDEASDKVKVYYSTTEGLVKRFEIDPNSNPQKPLEFEPTMIVKLDNPYPINGICMYKQKNWFIVSAMNGFLGCFSTKESDMVEPKKTTSFGTGGFMANKSFTTGTTSTTSTYGKGGTLSKTKVFKLIAVSYLPRIIEIGLVFNKLYIACINMQIFELDLLKQITPGKQTNPNEENPGTFSNDSIIQIESKQDSQISAFAIKEGSDGFISGSIQGRIEIKTQSSHNYNDVFHRTDQNLYSVNSVATCNDNVMMSGGGDGNYYFYNYADGKPLPKPGTSSYSTTTKTAAPKIGAVPITAVALSRNHDYCAWATGEDWSKGYEEHDIKVTPVTVFVKKVTPQDLGQQAKTTYNSYSSSYGKK